MTNLGCKSSGIATRVHFHECNEHLDQKYEKKSNQNNNSIWSSNTQVSAKFEIVLK